MKITRQAMTKKEVLDALTKLYDICASGSSKPDDSWSRMAGAISTAEDVAWQEANATHYKWSTIAEKGSDKC